jgi:hypothetical protein
MIDALLQALSKLLSRADCALAGDPHTAPDTVICDPPALGCGWFDSSHDLASGLRVQELATPEALAQALPLGSWLELELAASSR